MAHDFAALHVRARSVSFVISSSLIFLSGLLLPAVIPSRPWLGRTRCMDRHSKQQPIAFVCTGDCAWAPLLRCGLALGLARGHLCSDVGLRLGLRVGTFAQMWACAWACARAPLHRCGLAPVIAHGQLCINAGIARAHFCSHIFLAHELLSIMLLLDFKSKR